MNNTSTQEKIDNMKRELAALEQQLNQERNQPPATATLQEYSDWAKKNKKRIKVQHVCYSGAIVFDGDGDIHLYSCEKYIGVINLSGRFEFVEFYTA